MAKNKFYAVKKGLVPGIYESWEECKPNVIGCPGAIYKGFPTLKEAENYLNPDNDSIVDETSPNDVIAYVDGSYDEETGYYSCGVVVLRNGHESYMSDSANLKEMATMRNVAGEIIGAQLAMQYALDNGLSDITIVHDYQGISCWCTGEWTTNKEGTRAFKKFYDEISSAVNVHFQKVKGHNGVFYNELADALAKLELGLDCKKTLKDYINNHQ
jgi:ribonuclease HI